MHVRKGKGIRKLHSFSIRCLFLLVEGLFDDEKHTDSCFFVFGLFREIVSVDMGDVAQLLGLILVELKCFFVQTMLDGVCSQLIILLQRV